MFSLSFRHFFIAKKVLWFLFSFTFVGLIPHEKLRHWCNDKSSLIGFRIFSRSLSTVITIHNDEYKPKQCGFCVANHTSPIDIVILSTDCTYSLVSTRMLYLFQIYAETTCVICPILCVFVMSIGTFLLVFNHSKLRLGLGSILTDCFSLFCYFQRESSCSILMKTVKCLFC